MGMAACTGKGCIGRRLRASPHVVHTIDMTTDTVALHDPGAVRTDRDRLVEILQREGLGVFKAVFGLSQVFADQVVRHVAIITGGNRMVTRLLPAIILVLHDVAIRTGRRRVSQIRKTLPFMKRKTCGTEQCAEQATQQEAFRRHIQTHAHVAFQPIGRSRDLQICTHRHQQPMSASQRVP